LFTDFDPGAPALGTRYPGHPR